MLNVPVNLDFLCFSKVSATISNFVSSFLIVTFFFIKLPRISKTMLSNNGQSGQCLQGKWEQVYGIQQLYLSNLRGNNMN